MGLMALRMPTNGPGGTSAKGDEGPDAAALREMALAASRGDREAIHRVLISVAPRVQRAARGVLGTGAPDVDDATQESLIALVDALPRFRGECSVVGYATRIAVRTSLRLRRQQRARGDREQRSAQQAEDEGRLEPVAALDGKLLAHRRRDAMREVLASLPDEQAETLLLRIVLGFSLAEVADATGVPVNTVRSRVRLGKQSMRRRLESPDYQRQRELLRADR